ncbi:hypothetical protein T03_17413 [Trichinella britovi]|uniref:Uncharacterized protein n=1 Tax=Trichinella britovi TaxID=45882 RepID=A0A0V1DH22_TRIBR|nr:hypothetical protein T03_17413 [Trichinella britovi]
MKQKSSESTPPPPPTLQVIAQFVSFFAKNLSSFHSVPHHMSKENNDSLSTFLLDNPNAAGRIRRPASCFTVVHFRGHASIWQTTRIPTICQKQFTNSKSSSLFLTTATAALCSALFFFTNPLARSKIATVKLQHHPSSYSKAQLMFSVYIVENNKSCYRYENQIKSGIGKQILSTDTQTMQINKHPSSTTYQSKATLLRNEVSKCHPFSQNTVLCKNPNLCDTDK